MGAIWNDIKLIIASCMTDGNGLHELTAYSFLLTTVGLHALLIYHEVYCVPALHSSLTEYATAMGLNVSGHGIAYMTRAGK
jgi:hypothetical protein